MTEVELKLMAIGVGQNKYPGLEVNIYSQSNNNWYFVIRTTSKHTIYAYVIDGNLLNGAKEPIGSASYQIVLASLDRVLKLIHDSN